MVIGLSGVQFSLKHASDRQNRTTAKRESDFLITSMITCRIGRHEVLLRINQNFKKIQERNQTSAIRNVSKKKGQQRVHMTPTVHLYRHDVLLHCPITSMTRSLSY